MKQKKGASDNVLDFFYIHDGSNEHVGDARFYVKNDEIQRQN